MKRLPPLMCTSPLPNPAPHVRPEPPDPAPHPTSVENRPALAQPRSSPPPPSRRTALISYASLLRRRLALPHLHHRFLRPSEAVGSSLGQPPPPSSAPRPATASRSARSRPQRQRQGPLQGHRVLQVQAQGAAAAGGDAANVEPIVALNKASEDELVKVEQATLFRTHPENIGSASSASVTLFAIVS
ncbi:hypothetical protein ACP70R_003712 [Stipagrostis hirtigluma subsp. patula]